MSLISSVKSSKLYCKIQYTVWSAEDKIKNKVKDEVDYIKEHPGRAAAKVATNVVVNTVIPAGRVVNPAVKYVTKKVIDKDRVKSV